jgi:hypothetical protein
MSAGKLPPEFADLERWVARWALPTERERYFRLLERSVEELRPFYDAMLARAPEIVAWLSKQPAGEMTGPARLLYDLMLTFVETAHPIELKWKQTDIETPVDPARLQFHGPSAAPYGVQS